MLLSSRGEFPSAPAIAKTLHMSERTLRRRLEAENTSYQTIVNDVRNHLARQYLADTDLSVADVGALIGFEDLSNFRQALPQVERDHAAAQFRVLALAKEGKGAEKTQKEARR